MAKKKTALHQAARGKQAWSWHNLLPGLAVLTLLLAALFGWQFYVVAQEKLHRMQIQSDAEQVAATMARTIQNWQQRLDQTGRDPALISTLKSDQPPRMTLLEGQVRKQYPKALRLRIIRPENLRYEPEDFPGLGLGVLDMLMEARSHTNPIPAELHLFKTEHQHINLVSRVMDDRGRLLALLLLSMPADSILQAMPAEHYPFGHLSLYQGSRRWDDLLLQIQGKPVERVPELSLELNVPHTRMILKGGVQPGFLLIPNRSLWVNGAALLVSLLLFALVLRLWAKHRKSQQAVVIPATSLEAVAGKAMQEREEQQKRDRRDEAPAPVVKEEPPQPTGLTAEIFRAYDIRGIVDQTLTAEVARQIGQAIGSEAIDRGQQVVVVGRDGRHSGPMLAGALMEGLQAAGVDVIDIGAVPTGVLYFATYHLNTGSGVMVTGSHNPPEYNGFKIMLGGDTLSGDDIVALYQRIVDNRLHQGNGGAQEMDLLPDYVERIADDVQLEEPLKVVVDCGNGIAGAVAPEVLTEIGAEAIPLYCDVDGDFPNHHPDPSVPANLEDLILSVKNLEADLGVAFDGDGDRLGVVTAEGEIIYPDRLLMLFARDVLSRQPGATIVFDVKCSAHLAKDIQQHTGVPDMYKTGHSFIKGHMKETGAPLGGEMSGHFFFKERWYGFDDGIYAAARLLEILAAEGRPAQEVFDELPQGVSTPELKIEMAEGETFPFLEQFIQQARFPDGEVNTIDGIRVDFADGWGLIRCSNTTPVLVLRFEGLNEEALQRIQNVFRENLLALKADLQLPF